MDDLNLNSKCTSLKDEFLYMSGSDVG